MNPELISAIGGAIAIVLGAWNARQGRQLKALREQVDTLTGWRTTATEYIGQLMFALALHGIKPPKPPESLGLVVIPSQDEQDKGT